MNLDLTGKETAALLRAVDGITDGDSYFLATPIKTVRAVISFCTARAVRASKRCIGVFACEQQPIDFSELMLQPAHLAQPRASQKRVTGRIEGLPGNCWTEGLLRQIGLRNAGGEIGERNRGARRERGIRRDAYQC